MFSFLPTILVSGCEDAATNGYDVPTWSFSGVVLDGSSDSALQGAAVEYLDADGVRIEVVTDATGKFVAAGIPYGQTVLRFACRKQVNKDSSIVFGTRLVGAASYNESGSSPGSLAGGSRVVRLYPLSGSMTGRISVFVGGSGTEVPARGVLLRAIYRDTTFVAENPSSFLAVTDSTGTFRFSGLPADSGIVIGIPRFVQDGRTYGSNSVGVPMLRPGQVALLGRTVVGSDSASDRVESIASSNVLDASGLGLSGIGVTTVPWFRIAFPFDSAHLDARVMNATTVVPVMPRVHGDTIFLPHPDRLPADAQLSVEITGIDKKGVRFHVLLDGDRRFRTRKALAAVESNTWNTSNAYRPESRLGDTLWVRFSEVLSSDLGDLQWSPSGSARTIWGRGPDENAKVWVKAETLFVVPDQRLNIDTVGTLGFKVAAVGVTGAQSESVTLSSPIASVAYSVKWSNAINALGEFRDDLGSRDSIVIVSSHRIASILGLVKAEPGVLPSGIQIGDIVLRGDTIVYKPSSSLPPGTVYGLAFDIKSPEGLVFRKALQVRWKTTYRLAILSSDNRDGTEFRRFRTQGDSLVVRFSRPIDTTKPFVVHMVDARGGVVQVATRWRSSLDQVVLRNVSPLPLANYGIATTTNSTGDSARAVADVTFDLQSVDGERIYGLRPAYDSLRIYVEEGLCAVSSNILKSHVPGYEVGAAEAVVDSFPVNGTIRVGFNRALDTAWIRRNGDSTFVNLQLASGSLVPADIRFEDGGRTVVLDPRNPLVAGTSYNIQFIRIPGLSIRDAIAIGRHGGTYSGTNTSGFLLGSTFKAR